jgi:membrane-associated phospholipid phosphatase
MSAQGLAFTTMFALVNNTQFDPGSPRGLTSATYTDDFNAVKALGRKTGSTRTDDQTALALFWDGNASVHWNQAANQIARAHHLSMSAANRLLAVLNIAMADTAFTAWSGKRFYGSVPNDVTWRPVTSIPLADTDGNPDTAPDSDWLPLITTPSHPEYPAGHPSQNGAGATVLLSHFGRRQTFTLSTAGQPDRTYTSIAQARSDGNNARVWGGMHYPSTVVISDALGEAVAEYVNQHSMQRRRGGNDDDRR